MLQDEDYDSDTSDEDFVPQGVESDDEVVSDAPEDSDVEGSEAANKKNSTKSKKGKGSKKKGNPLLASINSELKDDDQEKEEEIKDPPDDKKVDDLWADFLADTEEKPAPAPKPKSNSWASLLGGKKSNSEKTSEMKKPAIKPAKEVKPIDIKDATKPDTIKITKVFEFAGEEVRVEEEVASNSAEAKLAQLQNTEDKDDDKSPNTKGATKRPAGLASVLGILDSKKQKLSTLEKTKLDWNKYKTSEGIVEELEMHKKSKDGYLEKKEFLERADLRQFEIERSLRMGTGKRSNR